jgi:hypothetical protein
MMPPSVAATRGVTPTRRREREGNHADSPRLIIEHTQADRTASVGLSLSAEAAEGLAFGLLKLPQECREARDADD